MGLFKRRAEKVKAVPSPSSVEEPESDAERIAYCSRDCPRQIRGSGVAHDLFSAGYLTGPFDDSWAVRDNRPCPAVSWYEAAAEGGNTEAQFFLGYSYEHGIGTATDVDQAIRWYSRAAAAGYAKASFCLGCIYAGDGGRRDYGRAYRYMERACTGGYSHAGVGLYEMYSRGLGLGEPNTYMGEKWLKEAAEDGDPDALYALAHLSLYGGDYVPADQDKAWKLMQQAAFAGSVCGLASLGVMYLFGLGCRNPDPQIAYSVLMAAADRNSAVARNALGIMHAYGIVVPRDPAKSFELMREASDMGDISATNNLGILYKAGYGVEEDRVKAMNLFHLASEKGSSAATGNYGDMASGKNLSFEILVGNLDLSFTMHSDSLRHVMEADAEAKKPSGPKPSPSV